MKHPRRCRSSARFIQVTTSRHRLQVISNTENARIPDPGCAASTEICWGPLAGIRRRKRDRHRGLPKGPEPLRIACDVAPEGSRSARWSDTRRLRGVEVGSGMRGGEPPEARTPLPVALRAASEASILARRSAHRPLEGSSTEAGSARWPSGAPLDGRRGTQGGLEGPRNARASVSRPPGGQKARSMLRALAPEGARSALRLAVHVPSRARRAQRRADRRPRALVRVRAGARSRAPWRDARHHAP